MSQFTTLRSEVKSWNLGSDDKLIKGIQQFSDKLFQNAQTSLDSFQELKYLLNSCNIEINNTFSQYQKLSERKFTEQKMALIGDAIPTQEDKKDTQDRISTEAKRIDFFKNALSKGLEAFNIGGNDEQNDDFQDERSVSQNSITYSVTSATSGIMKNQRLPFFIGSKIFMDDRHIGLILRDDDEDEDAPQDGQNIISQDVYDPNTIRTQSQINGNSVQQADINANGIPQAPPIGDMSGIPPAPPINMNGVPAAPPLIPPAPSNGIPPAPPVNLNQSGIPNAPPIIVNSNAPPAPPMNLIIPPPPPMNMQGSSAAPLIPPQNSMGLDNSSVGDEGNLQQQLLMALQKQSNRQIRAPSNAQPRPLTLQEEIQKIGRQKNQDHALVEQEEDSSLIRPPLPPQNNAPFRMSVRDALTQSIIGDPMAASSQDQNNNSQTKQVNKQPPVPSALFSQARFHENLMNDEDDEEEKQRPNTRGRSTRFTFNNLFNIEKPQFDEDDQIELDKNKNNKSNATPVIQQPSEGKKVQFMEPNQQSNLLPPPPIAPPIPVLKQEVPKKRLEKLFESSDEDSKDPFAKAQKIGQQYRQEEKQAKIQAITRQNTNNNTKKMFDDSDSDVENFKSKQTPQPPAQNNPLQKQTTTRAKFFNSDSEDDKKKPNQQAPIPVVNNPLAASNNSKPQTDIKPAIKNPLGGLGARVSNNKKRGIMDDSSQNSNSEDESSAQAKNSQVAALKQQQEAEKQRLEAEKIKQEAERIQREQEQARLQQEEQKRQQEKEEEEERRRKLEQEEQMRQLKLKQQEEERILRQKMEEEQKKKQQEEEEKKKQAAASASQQSQPVAGFGRTAQKKKKNKFGSSSENEDSDEEDNYTDKKTPAPPVIQPTSSIITYNQSSDPAPVLNPMEDALKNTETQSSTQENPSRNQSLTNRVSQALKDKIEAMGNLDPTKMLKGMTFIPKKPEQVQEQVHNPTDEQQQDSQQPIDKQLLISSQMDRVSIPMKKKKARTVQKFIDNSDQQQLTSSNNYNNNKVSIILPDDDDEKPLAIQKRNIHIKEKQSTQPATSNLPNISSMPKKGLDLGNSDDDSGPLMQKKTQPLSKPSNPVSQSQPKAKGVLDLVASDDDNDKPLMSKKSQAPPILPPLPTDDGIKPIQPNPPAILTSSQKNDDSAAQNKLLKGLPNILGAPKSENKKSTKLKFGDSDDDNDDKPLALTEKRQVQSLMPQNTQSNSKQNKDDDDLGIKPIARNSESLQGASGLPIIISNPLSSNSNQTPSRPSGLPNISSNPLGKNNMVTNKEKKEQKKKKVMFSDDEEEEEQDSKPPMPKLSHRPSAGLSNDASENVPKQTSLPQRPSSKKNLFGDDSDDDQISINNTATKAPKPPERPSVNLSGKPKGRNLFDDSDDDDKKPSVSASTSNPLSQSSNMNTAPLKPQLPSLSKPTTSNRNMFNDDSNDETLQNVSKNPLGQAKANPLAQSRPSQNPLGGGKQAPPAKPKKSLFDDSD
ncbi:hypothetical protein ABPG72_013772 [Tetrahymena utriculariae]